MKTYEIKMADVAGYIRTLTIISKEENINSDKLLYSLAENNWAMSTDGHNMINLTNIIEVFSIREVTE